MDDQDEFERRELESFGLTPIPEVKVDADKEAEALMSKVKALKEVQEVKNRDELAPKATPEELRERYERALGEEEKAAEKRDWRRRVDREMRSETWEDHCPPVFRDAKIPDLPEDLKKICEEWFDGENRNLIMCGATGTGKSWTAYSIARELYIERKDFHITEVAVWLDAIKPTVEGADAEFNRAKRCGVLFLEDLGAERHTSSGWGDDRIQLLIDHRWQWKLPTIVTTNVSPDGLFEILNERTVSRLLNNAIIKKFIGDDRRLT